MAGYWSAYREPSRELHGSATKREQLLDAAKRVRSWVADGTEKARIAIPLVQAAARTVREALNLHGVALNFVKTATDAGDQPKVLKMHTAKGIEFNRVTLFDFSKRHIPVPWRLKDAAPAAWATSLLREQLLLYVASSRARVVAVSTWREKPLELLDGAAR